MKEIPAFFKVTDDEGKEIFITFETLVENEDYIDQITLQCKEYWNQYLNTMQLIIRHRNKKEKRDE